jgi:hypothetical protein
VPVLVKGGPVQAEVFVLRMHDCALELAGPSGPEPWYIEVGANNDPLEVVRRLAHELMDQPLLAHSTSWRSHFGTFHAPVEPPTRM